MAGCCRLPGLPYSQDDVGCSYYDIFKGRRVSGGFAPIYGCGSPCDYWVGCRPRYCASVRADREYMRNYMRNEGTQLAGGPCTGFCIPFNYSSTAHLSRASCGQRTYGFRNMACNGGYYGWSGGGYAGCNRLCSPCAPVPCLPNWSCCPVPWRYGRVPPCIYRGCGGPARLACQPIMPFGTLAGNGPLYGGAGFGGCCGGGYGGYGGYGGGYGGYGGGGCCGGGYGGYGGGYGGYGGGCSSCCTPGQCCNPIITSPCISTTVKRMQGLSISNSYNPICGFNPCGSRWCPGFAGNCLYTGGAGPYGGVGCCGLFMTPGPCVPNCAPWSPGCGPCNACLCSPCCCLPCGPCGPCCNPCSCCCIWGSSYCGPCSCVVTSQTVCCSVCQKSPCWCEKQHYYCDTCSCLRCEFFRCRFVSTWSNREWWTEEKCVNRVKEWHSCWDHPSGCGCKPCCGFRKWKRKRSHA